MSNKIMKFVSEMFGNVRARVINGEAWFIAKDVCKALELKDVTSALRALEDGEKMTIANGKGQTNDPAQSAESKKRGGARMYNVINEPGLYRLIFASRMPKARDFQHWVFYDILPKLRLEAIRLEIRENGKKTRHDLTDTVKKFIEYLRARGELDRDPVAWYTAFTNLAKKAAGAGEKRDYLQAVTALRLQDAEDKLAATIEDGMSAGKVHHDIWLDCNKILNVEE